MGLGLGKAVDASTLSDAATRLRHLERAIQAKCGLTRAMVFWALTNQISTLDRGKLVRIGKQAYGIA
jgi:hypothetical protein